MVNYEPLYKIGAFGAAFYLLELVSIIVLKPFMRRNLKNGKKKLTAEDATFQVATRLVGFIHNSIQCPLGLVVLTNQDFRRDPMYANSNLSTWMVMISAGFFLYDMIMCLVRYKLEGPFYLLHGTACFWVYTYAYYSGFLHYFGAAYLMWELSTPFVHLRWLLYIMNMENSSLYFLNGVAMMVSFFACRIVWGYYISSFFLVALYGEYTNPRPNGFPPGMAPWYGGTCIVLNCLNTFWMWKMIQKVLDVLVQGKSLGDVSSHKDE